MLNLIIKNNEEKDEKIGGTLYFRDSTGKPFLFMISYSDVRHDTWVNKVTRDMRDTDEGFHPCCK